MESIKASYLRTALGVAALAASACTAAPQREAAATPAPARAHEDGTADLVGRPAQPWHVDHWVNSAPLELAALRGRVVLVRFWTAPDCPFCGATAPALNDFHKRYSAQGLTVVGFYHHKDDAPLQPESVAGYVKTFGFEFPVAIDSNWSTLKAWWLDGHDRGFTSASFLIDRSGVIRHVHPGGQYVAGDPAYQAMQSKIEQLLAESAPTARR